MVLALSACIFSLSALQAKQETSANQSPIGNQSITLDVQNMTCAMCKITLKKALNKVDGVQNIDVDFDAKTATVAFDPNKTSTEAIIKATTNVGYPSTVRQSN
ncbi:MAG: cation transporter [Gammaproteobacteria bacterium]|nr:cation transporter [Gammaproteobacteria bacterium]